MGVSTIVGVSVRCEVRVWCESVRCEGECEECKSVSVRVRV